MTRTEANKLLDQIRDGKLHNATNTRTALKVTGDIKDYGGEGMDNEIQEESQGSWEAQSLRLVADNLIRHREKAWVTRR